MSQGPLSQPLHPSRRQYDNACIDNSTSASHSEHERLLSLHASSAKMNSIFAHLHSSPRMKDTRFPHTSSSSDEPLAPVPTNLQRWRHPRQPLFATLPRRQCIGDRPLSPASFILDQVDERPSSTAAPSTSKVCIRKLLSSAKCAPTETQQTDAIDSIPSKRRRTEDLHCEEPPTVSGDDIDVDNEDKKKLLMWHAACAMAHAYVHRHDQHQHDLHHGNQHELSFHTPHSGHHICNVALNDESKQVNGPLLQEENDDMRSVTKHINNPLSSSSPPPSTSNKDGANTFSMCLHSDVVCIDEVVNPTQAAEWFGTLFSSTSTLVS